MGCRMVQLCEGIAPIILIPSPLFTYNIYYIIIEVQVTTNHMEHISKYLEKYQEKMSNDEIQDLSETYDLDHE